MASLFICTTPSSDIDYALPSGRVRSFVLRGETLYDEKSGVAVDGWHDRLVEFVREHGLDVDDGHGLHAFVYKMQEDGLLPVNQSGACTGSQNEPQ